MSQGTDVSRLGNPSTQDRGRGHVSTVVKFPRIPKPTAAATPLAPVPQTEESRLIEAVISEATSLAILVAMTAGLVNRSVLSAKPALAEPKQRPIFPLNTKETHSR